jgi:hypothetical protein
MRRTLCAVSQGSHKVNFSGAVSAQTWQPSSAALVRASAANARSPVNYRIDRMSK